MKVVGRIWRWKVYKLSKNSKQGGIGCILGGPGNWSNRDCAGSSILFFFLFGILEFEFKVSHLLCKHSTT
jgi:hypothetical protein